MEIKMNLNFKQGPINIGYLILVVLPIILFLFHKDPFFIEALFYGLFLVILIYSKIPKSVVFYLQLAIWGTTVSGLGLVLYGNYFMDYQSVPFWLESLREQSLIYIIALPIAGIVLAHKKEIESLD